MPSSSFQKCVGIEGNGFVHTSSPLSSYTGLPRERECVTFDISHQRQSFLTVVIPALYGHGEVPSLDLPAVDGDSGILPSETRDDVSASRDGAKQYVSLDAGIDIVIARRFQRGARGEDGVQRR